MDQLRLGLESLYECGKCGGRLDSCVSSILLGSFCTDITFAKYCDPATTAIKADFQKKYRKEQDEAKKDERHFDCVVRVPDLPEGHPLEGYAGCIFHEFRHIHYMQRAVIADSDGCSNFKYHGMDLGGIIRSLEYQSLDEPWESCKIGSRTSTANRIVLSTCQCRAKIVFQNSKCQLVERKLQT